MQKKSIESYKDKLMSKKKLKAKTREKGITLIALVITIIVLLILAGITINSVIGSKGILNNAKKATTAYTNAEAKEKAALILQEYEIQKAAAEAEGKTPESEEDFLKRKKDNGDIDDYKINGDGTPSEITIGGNKVPIIDGKPSDPQKPDNGNNTGSSSGNNPGSTGGGSNPGSTGSGSNPGSTGGGSNPGSTGSGSNPGSTGGGSNPGSTGGGSPSSSGDAPNITYTDTNNKPQPLTNKTPAGTKIGNTTITNSDNEKIKLDWYLFDVSDDGKTAYLVSTPTFWVPDTTKEVSRAWVPKLVSSYEGNTLAMRQAIQKLANGTNSYSSSSVTYTPTTSSLNYYKSVNSQWSAQRGSTAFASLNENEQAACYLADADIFAGIKDQVNNAEGNLKGKIKSLVGGASAEQWCNAYNKQSAASSSKITCEYRATSVPGYIYKVNGNTSTVSNSEYRTGTNTIYGDDIYGAANKNGHTSSDNKFYNNSWWWLASPSSGNSFNVCYVLGKSSYLGYDGSYRYKGRLSLFASVAL